MSALLVSMAVAVRTQTVEVGQMRNRVENGLTGGEDILGCLHPQGRGVPLDS